MVTRNRIKIHTNLFTKYFILAVAILGIQFTIITILRAFLRFNYINATLISIAAGIYLNWRYTSLFVFGTSKHHPFLEFIVSGIVVITGFCIQLATAKFSFYFLRNHPGYIIALALALGATWNYVLLRKTVYRSNQLNTKPYAQ